MEHVPQAHKNVVINKDKKKEFKCDSYNRKENSKSSPDLEKHGKNLKSGKTANDVSFSFLLKKKP